MNKLKLLQDWENTYKEISKTFDLFSELTGADAESPLFVALFNTHEQYTDVLALAIGANVEDLAWFIYENDCGAKQMAAKNPNWKKAKKIKNVKDLLRMIEDI